MTMGGEMVPRPPVVTIMGHVDHGKTSLLDAIRNANVVSGEAGGITQHIGAYQVEKNGQLITFIDTPGHEAFTAMRARGAQATDIVILVVAADDSVMPQTIESINHAKAAGVPMIVAINKMDKPDADPQRCAPICCSMKSGGKHGRRSPGRRGLRHQAAQPRQAARRHPAAVRILELKANPDRAAEGVVIEAKLDKGRGPVATVLVQRGTLKPGDILVAGDQWGRVRALVNDRGEQVKEAGPLRPVEVLGLQGTPQPATALRWSRIESRAREITEYRQRQPARRRRAPERHGAVRSSR
jgi:translation initiation factor IF-2